MIFLRLVSLFQFLSTPKIMINTFKNYQVSLLFLLNRLDVIAEFSNYLIFRGHNEPIIHQLTTLLLSFIYILPIER